MNLDNYQNQFDEPEATDTNNILSRSRSTLDEFKRSVFNLNRSSLSNSGVKRNQESNL